MKWRTLQPTIYVQVVGINYVLGSVQKVSYRLEAYASREKRLLQDKVQLGIKAKVQLQVGISRQVKVVGKIPYTCNRLIINQWILNSSNPKINLWGICLTRFFPFTNKPPCQIYFLLHLVFLVICWCLHNLHATEPKSTWVIELINRGKAILTQQVVSEQAHSD